MACGATRLRLPWVHTGRGSLYEKVRQNHRYPIRTDKYFCPKIIIAKNSNIDKELSQCTIDMENIFDI